MQPGELIPFYCRKKKKVLVINYKVSYSFLVLREKAHFRKKLLNFNVRNYVYMKFHHLVKLLSHT